VHVATHDLLGVAAEEIGIDGEAGDETGTGGGHIPVAGDLDGVFLVHHGIEDRLVGQTRGEGFPSALFDQSEFFGSDGTVEGDGVHASRSSRTCISANPRRLMPCQL